MRSVSLLGIVFTAVLAPQWTAAQNAGTAAGSQRATASRAPVAKALSAGCSPTVASLRKIALAEWNASQDAARVLRAVDTAIGPGADQPFIFISDTSDDRWTFSVQFPQRMYRLSLSEALRKRESISSATASSVIEVRVSVDQIGAPNIEKVIVERNGRVVPPLSNSLLPHVMVTRLGAKEVINSGALTFPCSTFFPGAQVTITGIPSVGANVVHRFNDDELETLSGRAFIPPTTSAGLVGLPVSRVLRILGETATRMPDRLGYDVTESSRLFVIFKGDVVVAVSDETVLLKDIKGPAKNPAPQTVELPADAPIGAVARCGDGQYAFRYEDAFCNGRSGVSVRFSSVQKEYEVTRCGQQVGARRWDNMSAVEQAAFCQPSSVERGEIVDCSRPAGVGTLDWQLMSADARAASCVPVFAEKPCPKPPTVGLLDWRRMNDEAKLAACQVERDRTRR